MGNNRSGHKNPPWDDKETDGENVAALILEITQLSEKNKNQGEEESHGVKQCSTQSLIESGVNGIGRDENQNGWE